MKRLRTLHRVFVGLVPTGYLHYEHLLQVIQDGMVFCGVPKTLLQAEENAREGKLEVLLRPDIMACGPGSFKNAYTHPEVVRATLDRFFSMSSSSLKRATPHVTIAEKAALDFSTARAFKKAHGHSQTYAMRGYYELEKIFPHQVSIKGFESLPHSLYLLSKPDKKELPLLAPKLFKDAGFIIYCPKLKTNLSAGGMSAAIALGDLIRKPVAKLQEHFVQMLEICNPHLIVSDGIVAATGSPYYNVQGNELGVILISNNALAHDWISATLLGINPLTISHLKMASEQGWGPSSMYEIEVGGAGLDSVELLAKKNSYWDFPISKILELEKKYGSAMEVLNDHSPTWLESSFCDWIESIYRRHPDTIPNQRKNLPWPAVSVVLGSPEKFPESPLVLVYGDRSIRHFLKKVSKVRFKIKIRSLEILFLQMKNSSMKWTLFLHGSPPSERALFWSFALLSPIKLLPFIFQKEIFKERRWTWFRRFFGSIPIERFQKMKPRKLKELTFSSSTFVQSSELISNRFWTLPKEPYHFDFKSNQVKLKESGG